VKLYLIIILSLLTVPFGSGSTGIMLTLRFEGMKSYEGQVLVAVYDRAEECCTNPEKAHKKLAFRLSEGSNTYTLNGLRPGNYAIVAVHDANANGQMDTNFFGLPKEDYAVSNGAKNLFGPPKFQDAAFPLSGSKTVVLQF